MKKTTIWILTFAVALSVTLSAHATTQWSRKTGISCNVCHSAGFPRLTYYGEKYQRNGYQEPGKEDGDDAQKKVDDSLTVPRVEDWFGVRLNFTPVKMDTNSLQLGADSANKKTKYTIGNADWAQFFVAGNIYKNVSIFIEMEHQVDKFKFSWNHLGFHNLFGSTAFNLRFGQISAVEWSTFTNRLPQFVALKNSIFQQKSATADKALDISSARAGIDYYGYQGPLLWWAGVSPGGSSGGTTPGVNTDNLFNVWGGLRADMPSGTFEGSGVSLWAEQGGESKNVTTAGSEKYYTTKYTRYQAATNIRAAGVDFQGAYIWGNWDDFDVSDSTLQPGGYKGYGFQASYDMGNWVPGVMFDRVISNGEKSTPSDPLTASGMLRYTLRQNMHVTAYATLDLNKNDDPKANNSYQLNFRTMF